MALETVRVTAVLPASPERVYAAWLDSEEHSRMTGARAVVDPAVGGQHSAWDGYISGRNVELEPARRIVQTWRSTDFPLGSGDSRLEVHLREADGGTEITVIHAQIPEGQGAQYEQGWNDHYFAPMRKYFTKQAARPATKKAGRKPKKTAPARAKAPARTRPSPRKAAARKPAPKTRKPSPKASKKPATRKK
jgi:uncharacterized protein YndB with AHSA1/START domain